MKTQGKLKEITLARFTHLEDVDAKSTAMAVSERYGFPQQNSTSANKNIAEILNFNAILNSQSLIPRFFFIVPFGHFGVQSKSLRWFKHFPKAGCCQPPSIGAGKPASKRRLRPLLGLSGYRNTCISGGSGGRHPSWKCWFTKPYGLPEVEDLKMEVEIFKSLKVFLFRA